MTKECFTSKSSPAPHTGEQFSLDVLCPDLRRTLCTGLGEWLLHRKKLRHIEGQWQRRIPCEQSQRWRHASVSAVALSKSLSWIPMMRDEALPLAFWAPSSHSSWSLHFCQMLEQCNSVFSSVQSLSRVRLCDPMNGSMPGLPVHRQLPESTQTHVHWVGDAIQPSHPLSSPSPPAFNLSQHKGLFRC